MVKDKVVLAYSGGLDTSVILTWLIDEGYDVICFIADVGQDEDLKAAKEKAIKCGATKVYVEDLRTEFVTDFIFQALKGNAMYENRYLLGTSLARPIIAKKQIEIAQKEKAKYVAHGATGKGNDQVRFELTYYALNPSIHVIAPWKIPKYLQQFQGRSDLIKYAESKGIPIKASVSKPYSEDGNLMHLSHEAGILEDTMLTPTEDMFEITKSPMDAPNKQTVIEIDFKNGLPVKVTNKEDGTVKTKPLEMFLYLNELAKENGVGRIDIVENRFVGIKSRGVYETPGATILWAAHRDIEGIAMDREVMHIKQTLEPKFAELIYNGFWYSPEMDFLMAAFNKSQEFIDGKVVVGLYKGNVMILGRESPTSLYNKELSSMDVEGGFDQTDSKGFIRINAIRLKAHKVILNKKTLGLK
ncbi:MAG: argininosuccinate synthase [Candidatus Methanofastidiosum methylothiophilum]|uniref:Argininosuccinate synthase n=1 Tax=Candidatus Methanofastidiosum methylothiophilum TaxID=1705564 RepID=A0A150J4Z9_9EURY|nr:MAG: argininosuccinate synthase [Candidatus Methanofastidiosum methylthiophilus]